jgi:hypothetical protein
MYMHIFVVLGFLCLISGSRGGGRPWVHAWCYVQNDETAHQREHLIGRHLNARARKLSPQSSSSE